ncbi:hypothetical protein K461DRAFT_221427 [Myriangium duriaei CBS 260.36]|uniref:Fumarylacetoacetase-like C-terminal domain-containing protein n=1 Tax=Myriangium duriaei CBS 260.36 TaxID=1168546 RepID=A0A9P4J7W9_9PEZI|nr:hypothetical protein K461DRAFT_221427 [Myriangium duriaei CBS 260.36]
MSNLSSIRQNCRKVVCIGRNYADHVTELNNQRPKQPFFFLKPSSSILLPGEGPVLRPKGVNLHFEVELGVILGKTVRDLDHNDKSAWLDAIDSYLLAIDMTARNVQEEAKKKGYPWDVCKGFDTFLPLQGPISKSVIKDPHDIELWLKINGQTKQQDSTNLMLFQIPRQLSDISKVMTLEKGDIVLTGTPKGVGPVTTGDVLTAGIRVDGKEIEEAKLEVGFEDKPGPYEYQET